MELAKFICDFERAVLGGNENQIRYLFEESNWKTVNEGELFYRAQADYKWFTQLLLVKNLVCSKHVIESLIASFVCLYENYFYKCSSYMYLCYYNSLLVHC